MTRYREPDDDTDPDTSRPGARRDPPTTPEESAISNESRGAWRLGLVVGGIAAGLVALVGIDHQLSVAAAQGVVEMRVAPLEKRFDAHEATDRGSAEMASYRSKEITETLAQIRAQLAALCRASSRPQVCLGGE